MIRKFREHRRSWLGVRYENCAVVQRKERRGSEDDIDGAGLRMGGVIAETRSKGCWVCRELRRRMWKLCGNRNGIIR